ncbi:MAG TPA: S41 family peptidase [Pyrinomonadaceae bacterium]|nr:S41 family peptidase [Pyrinomonadaceae bacterium]
MKNKNLVPLLIFLIIFHSLPVFGQNDFLKAQISDADKLKVFNNLWEIVNRLYFDSTFNGNDWRKLRDIYQPQTLKAKNKIELKQILNKMVGELNTSHLEVSFEISLSGKTLKRILGENIDYKQNTIPFGYGFETAKFDDQTVVKKVEKNSPADQKGVKVGWIQKTCEFIPVTKEIADSITYGETANCVFVTETEDNKVISINQNLYLVPISKTYRESKIIDGSILYLKFTEFDKGLGSWVERQISANSNAKTVIIDLRDNFGGLTDELRKSLSVFFPPKTAVGEFIERDLDEKKLIVGSENYYKGNVIVLINGGSYSSAEIFAAAVQDLGRGKIAGQVSGGQVLNSLDKSLSNGYKLQIALRDYKTIKGVRLEKKGVTPDRIIPFSIKDFRNRNDVVLAKVLEDLKY